MILLSFFGIASAQILLRISPAYDGLYDVPAYIESTKRPVPPHYSPSYVIHTEDRDFIVRCSVAKVKDSESMLDMVFRPPKSLRCICDVFSPTMEHLVKCPWDPSYTISSIHEKSQLQECRLRISSVFIKRLNDMKRVLGDKEGLRDLDIGLLHKKYWACDTRMSTPYIEPTPLGEQIPVVPELDFEGRYKIPSLPFQSIAPEWAHVEYRIRRDDLDLIAKCQVNLDSCVCRLYESKMPILACFDRPTTRPSRSELSHPEFEDCRLDISPHFNKELSALMEAKARLLSRPSSDVKWPCHTHWARREVEPRKPFTMETELVPLRREFMHGARSKSAVELDTPERARSKATSRKESMDETARIKSTSRKGSMDESSRKNSFSGWELV